MAQEFNFKTYDGTELYMRKDIIDSHKAVIVIVHGLCEHFGRYDYTTQKLNEQGYSVYRFDHRGHGRSQGKKVYYETYDVLIEDVNAVVELAKAEHPAVPLFVFGHSMGGFAATAFATKYAGKADGIILSGALTRNTRGLGAELPEGLPKDTYLPNDLGDGVCGDPAVVKAYKEDPLVEKEISAGLFYALFDGVEWLKKNPQQFTDPTLMLHGCFDGLVGEADSRTLYGEIASTDKKLIIYPKLCHEILNEREKDEVIADILHWLKKHLG